MQCEIPCFFIQFRFQEKNTDFFYFYFYKKTMLFLLSVFYRLLLPGDSPGIIGCSNCSGNAEQLRLYSSYMPGEFLT